ncbi:MAG: hypothetical protein PUJ17_03950 [Clostridia bacterium]|nr:hypothetical protein [Clostridia bacterium]
MKNLKIGVKRSNGVILLAYFTDWCYNEEKFEKSFCGIGAFLS